MRPFNQYTSKHNSKDFRVVAVVGVEELVERGSAYSVRTYDYIGQARVATFRGIDEENDPIDFVEAYSNAE